MQRYESGSRSRVLSAGAQSIHPRHYRTAALKGVKEERSRPSQNWELHGSGIGTVALALSFRGEFGVVVLGTAVRRGRKPGRSAGPGDYSV